MVLRIIESLADEPIRFPTDPDSYFVPGQVAQIDYNKMICGVSDGTQPLGLIDDIRSKSIDSTEPGGLISVWQQRMVFRTDQYEALEGAYITGASLFVNIFGFLTTIEPFEEALSVGRVISVFDAKQEYGRDIIECVWF